MVTPIFTLTFVERLLAPNKPQGKAHWFRSVSLGWRLEMELEICLPGVRGSVDG